MAKYDPLYDFLRARLETTVRIEFDEIEQLVGSLPPSAKKYRQWWENERKGSHVQAQSWLSAGYEVAEVEPGDYVVFTKS